MLSCDFTSYIYYLNLMFTTLN